MLLTTASSMMASVVPVSAIAVLPALRGCRTPLTLYADEGNC